MYPTTLRDWDSPCRHEVLKRYKASIGLSCVSWDEKKGNYKIVESSTVEGDVDELDQYVFVARARVGQLHILRSALLSLTMKTDKKTQDASHFINVKSSELKDALGTVLHSVLGVSLKGNKPSVTNLDYTALNFARDIADSLID